MALRLLLILGLGLHKLLWEVMKPGGSGDVVAADPSRGPRKRAVKYAKVGALGFLLFQTLFLNVLPISRQPRGLRALGTVIYIVGLATALLGRLQLGRNWANLEDFQVLPEQRVVREGLYKYIRHPIYTGDILLIAGLQLALNSWLVLGTLLPVAVVVRQAKAEEQLLAEQFSDYAAYSRETKKFIPFVA